MVFISYICDLIRRKTQIRKKNQEKVQLINRSRIAALLIVFFFGVILMKPVHFFFVDHDSNYTLHPHADGKTASLHHDCDICLFTLHAFTTHQFANLPPYFADYVAEILSANVRTFAYQFITHISLRGPPFV